MSLDRGRERGNASGLLFGTVKERDGPGRRIRATAHDEDETDSYWIHVPGKGGTANADYDMPDEGDEVAFFLDSRGERGVLHGSIFNDQDAAPESDPDVTRKNYRDGSSDRHDPAAKTRVQDAAGGTHTIQSGDASIVVTPGSVTISAGGSSITVSDLVAIVSALLEHNGTDVGDTHDHGGVMEGAGNTGPPN